MTEIIYEQPPEKAGRFGWLKHLLEDAAAGVVQGSEINSGITPIEARRPAASERPIGAVALVPQCGYTEAEQRAMIESADPTLQF